jgi:hypothetical protein
LDAGFVRDLPHDAPERVYLAYNVSFCNPAYCGIARHSCESPDIKSVECGSGTHSSRRHGSLASSVPASNNDNIKFPYFVVHYSLYSVFF